MHRIVVQFVACVDRIRFVLRNIAFDKRKDIDEPGLLKELSNKI
jgi:hypothetical protein